MKKWACILCFLSPILTWAQTSLEIDFQSDWSAWRVEREKGLIGWRNLTGLYWLEPGEQRYGFGQSMDHVFPNHREPAPEHLGTWILANDMVLQKTSLGVDTLYFQGKSTPSRWTSWEWFVIRRGDRWAVRARDTQHPILSSPVQIPTYPALTSWRIKGQWKPSKKKLTILDITGQVSQQPSAGTITFQVQGKNYQLDALGSPEELFFLVGDLSNRDETYGGGRYLYSQVESDGTVWLDFNRLINPPCAFTPFATCPLPPKENQLRVALRAGEKRVHD